VHGRLNAVRFRSKHEKESTRSLADPGHGVIAIGFLRHSHRAAHGLV
jgi:hypothetical protein